ncbi:hypothetical protein I8752_31410 [Nostocaceae cyanobacterium CENA369]|uniref:Uncharacterized protein n=1 Tax=Dendronalium phyllosphericum CENA369 TaxID=1725256 RepID=A0A8J7LJC3_9NOST|nr:hypothetical protein [Dendronalium phyllosphericum]MBH8577399.1 hypothetical protein [Dendronalium phyllosphericum CENA369]
MNSQLQLEPPPQALISPLVELRDYYARLVEEYENLYAQARSHLNHVEALLSHWSFSLNVNGKLSTLETIQRESPHQSLLVSLPDRISHTDNNSVSISKLSDDNLEIDNSAGMAEDTKKSSTSTRETLTEVKEYSIKVADIPMLPEHQPLTRMEAIKKLLEEHLGTVCHIDFIVRSLYGDLDPSVFKVVKGRVQSSLTQGRERNAWSAIPDEPGCYTLDLSLVTSNRTNGYSQAAKNKKKKPVILPQTRIVPMLKVYEGQFLIDALTSLLQQNPGKVFTVAEIIAGIYGDLDSEQVREIKSKVLNELSRGYRTGRFSKVPEKVGLYTWDSTFILETSSN